MNEPSHNMYSKVTDSSQWTRVSPIAIIYFFFKTLFFLINNVLLFMLPLVAFNFATIKENFSSVLVGATGLIFIILIASCIKYFFYRYRLGKDKVEIRQGMIKKSHLDLPFVKIQNIRIIQPFYYRLSDYSIVELDTAGSSQQEANIVAIRMPIAESFKRKVQGTPHTVNTNSQVESSEIDSSTSLAEKLTNDEILLNRRSIKDLIIHGITNNRIWIFLGFLAPLYRSISENVNIALTYVGFDINAYLSAENQSVLMVVLHLISIVLIIMLIVVIFSVLGSIFIFFNYTLCRQGKRYIRRSGLFTRHEVSMQVSRIQRVVQQQDWLDVLIGRANLSFEQNASGPASGNQAAQINTTSKLLVPSITPAEADELSKDVFAIGKLSDMPYQRVSRRLILRLMIFPSILTLMVFIPLLFSATDKVMIIASALGTTTLFLGLTSLRWYRWGFASDNKHLYVRKGFFGQDYIAFPIAKIQQTGFTQTPFMRAKQLASLHLVLASGGIYIPYLKQHIVHSVIDSSLTLVARDKPAWM